LNDWWKTFFDDDYLRIWGQILSEEHSAKQAAQLWSMRSSVRVYLLGRGHDRAADEQVDAESCNESQSDK
jgi:hypothetical protein